MLATKIRRVRCSESGQVMVLGVMGVLIVALTMLLTLNVGKAVFEKIRIQQLADSAAFSTATVEARSFNFYAYTNRANIAGLVAGVSAHGFMSLASTVPNMFRTAAINFFIMAGIEFCICLCGCPPKCLISHCIHGIRDLLTGLKYWEEADDLEDNLQDTNSTFITTIKMLDLHMKWIAMQQQELNAYVLMKVGADSAATELVDKYSNQSENKLGPALLNAADMELSIETDKGKRKWVATEIANGTRHTEFVTNRCMLCFNEANIVPYIYPMTLDNLFRKIPKKYTNGFSLIIWHQGESRVIEGGDSVKSKISNSQAGPEGTGLAAADQGLILSQAYCAAMVGMYKATVGSNDGSGEHKCGWFFGSSNGDCCEDESDHDDAFKCLNSDGLLVHNCFMLYKSNDEPTEDWGQPKVVSVVDSDLRRTRGGGPKPVWELTDSERGKVAIDIGGDIGKHEMQLTDNPGEDDGYGANLGKGVAMSKAMVYYHLPEWEKGWKEQPNFFNPYWKAKLQPFRSGIEAEIRALAPAGYIAKYAPMLAGGLIVEVPLP
jgi:hypothetical protein